MTLIENEPRVAAVVSERTVSDFDKWVPSAYLKDFYSEIEPDELETIPFFVDAMSEFPDIPRDADPDSFPIAFFGIGPTLHHVFLSAPKASRIDLADYLHDVNLAEIKKWKDGDPDAHDWTKFIEYTLQCEGNEYPTAADIEARAELTKSRINFIDMKADAGVENPLGIERRESYPVVFSPYCADSATDNQDVWENYMHNISTLVKPGGTFITAALRDCKMYKVGKHFFPCANINETHMEPRLSLDFGPQSISIKVVDLTKIPGHDRGQGYSGVVLATAIKHSGIPLQR